VSLSKVNLPVDVTLQVRCSCSDGLLTGLFMPVPLFIVSTCEGCIGQTLLEFIHCICPSFVSGQLNNVCLTSLFPRHIGGMFLS
jgi:hypothetical protein